MKKQAQQQQEAAARAAMQKKLQDQEQNSGSKAREQEDSSNKNETDEIQTSKESKIEQDADDNEDVEDIEEAASDEEVSEKASEVADQEDQEDQDEQGQDEDEQAEEVSDDSEEEESEEEESEEEEDYEELFRQMIGKKLNKSGMVVDKKSGAVLGRLVEGKIKKLAGKKIGENGTITNDKGKIVGRVEPVIQDDDDDNSSDDDEDDEQESQQENDVSNPKDDKKGEEASKPLGNDDKKSTGKDNEDQKATKEEETNDNEDQKATKEEEAKDNEDQTATKEEAKDNNDSKQKGDENSSDEQEDTQKKDEDKEEDSEQEDKPFNPNDAINEDSPEVRKSGKIVDMEDNVVGTIDKKKAAKYAGLKVDKEGNVINEEGHIVAKAEMYPDEEENKPFNPNDAVNEDSPEVRKSGKIVDMEDNIVGTIDKEKAAKFAGLKVDKDGNVIDKDGHIVAKAELYPDEEENKPFNPNDAVNEDSPEVRKSGKIVDMEDNVIGTIDKEKAAKYAGLKVDKDGNVIDKEGHIVARAELFPDEEENKPFNPNDMVNEDSPEVRKSGKVFDMDDNLVGYVDKRIAPKVAGFKVDDQGNVIDPEGHVVARAEMIKQEEEEEPKEEPQEEEKDKPFNPNDAVDENSPEVRKSGKVFDMDDNLVGHVDKRLASKFAGFKVDEQGNIINPDGHIVGRAEMLPKEEEEPKEEEPKEEEKDKPFNPYAMIDENSPEVKKSGKVVDMDDNIVGHVDKRLAHKLAGFKVDEEGNVINNEGHIAGKAQMLPKEEENKEEDKKDKPFNPNTMVDEHSPRVRKSGKVVDEDDNIVGTVDKSAAHKMAGFPVDYDGNIIDPEGHIVGKAQMIKKDEDDKKEEKSDADKEEEEYRRIADQMSTSIQQSLDKIKPVLKRITETIDDEEAKPQKERDEKKLVDTVKPLIEQGSQILEEANGAIRGLDPTGRIAKKAQSNTSNRKASPEEYHLADLLAQLSGEVTTTIDRAKKKVRNMPHAKKELNPLWNILQSPLLQILSAVGLLLTGVLGLVGNILNGLGLGSIVNSLLGSIGLNKILEGFGLGDALKLGSKK